MKFKLALIVLLAGILLSSFAMITHAQTKAVDQQELMHNDLRELIHADSGIVSARDAKTPFQEKMELDNRRKAIDAYNLDAVGYPAKGFLPPSIPYTPNPTNAIIFDEFVAYGYYV